MSKILPLEKENLSRLTSSLRKPGELVRLNIGPVLVKFSENNGDTDWPAGCSLQYVSGAKLTNQTQIPVGPLGALSQTDG